MIESVLTRGAGCGLVQCIKNVPGFLLKARFLYRSYRARYRDERVMLTSLLAAVKPGDVALDIGANKGSYLWWLSRAVREGGVIAFEPQPLLADYLQRMVSALPLSNVRLEASAVSDQTGPLEMAMPLEGASPGATLTLEADVPKSWTRVRVPSVRLDDYCRDLRPVTAIKVDVEGHELNVFRGAGELIRRDRPVLAFECEQRHHPSDSITGVFQFLKDLGYQGWFVQRQRLRPLKEFNAQVHQCRAGPRYWDRKEYCNNFVFHPPRAT